VPVQAGSGSFAILPSGIAPPLAPSPSLAGFGLSSPAAGFGLLPENLIWKKNRLLSLVTAGETENVSPRCAKAHEKNSKFKIAHGFLKPFSEITE